MSYILVKAPEDEGPKMSPQPDATWSTEDLLTWVGIKGRLPEGRQPGRAELLNIVETRNQERLRLNILKLKKLV